MISLVGIADWIRDARRQPVRAALVILVVILMNAETSAGTAAPKVKGNDAQLG